jgi:mycothiol synthase
MTITMRAYQSEADYWRIRSFLRQVYLLNDRRERSWQTYRFDYWRWHGNANILQMPLPQMAFLWETAQGEIAAVLNPERMQDTCLQIHPEARTATLEQEMLDVAERELAFPDAQGVRKLYVWTAQDDYLRQEVLKERGYTRLDVCEQQRRRPMSIPIPNMALPRGYRLRPLGDVDELPARSWLSWRAFHPDEPDERYEGWEWYRNIQRAPLYRRDLDLVAEAPDGELAAFCTVWFDDMTRTGAFEPVGTAPEHRRRGLGKAVMFEGLRRLKWLGATLATVGSYSLPAGALYESAGFTDYDLSEAWVKQI